LIVENSALEWFMYPKKKRSFTGGEESSLLYSGRKENPGRIGFPGAGMRKCARRLKMEQKTLEATLWGHLE